MRRLRQRRAATLPRSAAPRDGWQSWLPAVRAVFDGGESCNGCSDNSGLCECRGRVLKGRAKCGGCCVLIWAPLRAWLRGRCHPVCVIHILSRSTPQKPASRQCPGTRVPGPAPTTSRPAARFPRVISTRTPLLRAVLAPAKGRECRRRHLLCSRVSM